jgi:hypothetical protein
MLFDAFNNDELGNDANISHNIFESLKSASIIPLFGPSARSKSTQLGTTMLLYNVKENFDISNTCVSWKY